jgi:hypothetical protein
MNITDGARYLATAKRVLTNASPSPIHLDVREELEMLKNVAPLSCEMALAIRVFLQWY